MWRCKSPFCIAHHQLSYQARAAKADSRRRAVNEVVSGRGAGAAAGEVGGGSNRRRQRQRGVSAWRRLAPRTHQRRRVRKRVTIGVQTDEEELQPPHGSPPPPSPTSADTPRAATVPASHQQPQQQQPPVPQPQQPQQPLPQPQPQPQQGNTPQQPARQSEHAGAMPEQRAADLPASRGVRISRHFDEVLRHPPAFKRPPDRYRHHNEHSHSL